jgi:UDP-N-acetylglucosamine acyltransferase
MPVAQIHPTAVVDSRAELGANVVVGPFCVVEAGAVIGEACQLETRAVVKVRTTLGCHNEIGEGAVIGGKAQHVHVHDPGGTLTIGDHNRIRENVTLHRGWANDATTTIGNHNLFMVGSHVGHDCRVGNHCILVNHVLLGGHVQVEDRAYLGGASAYTSSADRHVDDRWPGEVTQDAAVCHGGRRTIASHRPQQGRVAAQRLQPSRCSSSSRPIA